jgi:hypothetical protein
MQLNRLQFFLLLVTFFVLPFIVYKFIWLSRSKATNGVMCFMGKAQEGQLVRVYPVIKFSSDGQDTVFFNGNDDLEFKRGDIVPVRFQKNDPTDARINRFAGIWVDSIINASVPLLILLITFLHPDIIPRKSKIVVGKKPFIKFVADNRKSKSDSSPGSCC